MSLLFCSLAALAIAACDGGGGGDPGGGDGGDGGAGAGNVGGNGGNGGNGGDGGGGNNTGGNNTGGNNTGGQAEGWGEPDPGVTKGPFGYFKAFRSGCGEQIWARWIPKADFGLLEMDVSVGSNGVNVTYFEVPVFIEGEKTVYLLSDNGGWGEGTGEFEFTVANPDDTKLTHVLEAPVEELFRWPGQIELEDLRMDDSDGLQVTIDPKIDGNLVRMFLYEADTECLVYEKVLLDGMKISKNKPTEVDVGAFGLKTGKEYVMVMQGVDSARDYVYYATLELEAP